MYGQRDDGDEAECEPRVALDDAGGVVALLLLVVMSEGREGRITQLWH